MKKIFLILTIFITIFMFMGCKPQSKTSSRALEEGKIALACDEYDKARNLFSLSVDENNKNTEAQELYVLTCDFLCMTKAVDELNFEEADHYLDKLKESDKYASISAKVHDYEKKINENLQ